MTHVRNSAGLGLILLAMLSMAGQAQAQDVTLSTSTPTQMASGTTYQFDDMTFSFTCGSTCGTVALLGVSDSAGTGIEMVGDPPATTIFSGAAGGANYGTNLGVTVGLSTGISSVTDIINGSLAVPADTTHDATLVSSDMLSFNTTSSTATSNLSTPSTTVDFTSTDSVSFSDEIRANINSATTGDTLTLNNVTFIFQPAPEPASIALFATGLMGLTAARRRLSRRGKR